MIVQLRWKQSVRHIKRERGGEREKERKRERERERGGEREKERKRERKKERNQRTLSVPGITQYH